MCQKDTTLFLKSIIVRNFEIRNKFVRLLPICINQNIDKPIMFNWYSESMWDWLRPSPCKFRLINASFSGNWKKIAASPFVEVVAGDFSWFSAASFNNCIRIVVSFSFSLHLLPSTPTLVPFIVFSQLAKITQTLTLQQKSRTVFYPQIPEARKKIPDRIRSSFAVIFGHFLPSVFVIFMVNVCNCCHLHALDLFIPRGCNGCEICIARVNSIDHILAISNNHFYFQFH